MFTIMLGNPPYHVEGAGTKYKCYHFYIEQSKLLLGRFISYLIPSGLFNNKESTIPKKYLSEIRASKNFEVICNYSWFDENSPFHEQAICLNSSWFMMVNNLDDKVEKDVTLIKSDGNVFKVSELKSPWLDEFIFDLTLKDILEKVIAIHGKSYIVDGSVKNLFNDVKFSNTTITIKDLKSLNEPLDESAGGGNYTRVYISNIAKRQLQHVYLDKDNGLHYIYVNNKYKDHKVFNLKAKDYYKLTCTLRGRYVVTKLLKPNTLTSGASFCTDISISSKEELLNLQKYLRTSLAMYLYIALNNKTQYTREPFKLMPAQNFTNNSDIEWSKSIDDVNLQLYKKYNLSPQEIDVIENNYYVKYCKANFHKA